MRWPSRDRNCLSRKSEPVHERSAIATGDLSGEELKRLVRNVALLAMVTCLFAAVAFTLRDGSWIAGLLVAALSGAWTVTAALPAFWAGWRLWDASRPESRAP
jgi:hypothetical protein